jgi:hypothetical protein
MSIYSKAIRKAVLWGSVGLLAGCASTPPSPELLAATAPGPAIPATISGPALDRCLEELGSRKLSIDTQEAKYSQPLTLKFAEKFQHGPKVIKPYAARIRAYALESHRTNIFGVEGTTTQACYYDFPNGEPRFLAALSSDREGRVRATNLQQATLTAYAIMAGKSVAKIKLFGAYAD